MGFVTFPPALKAPQTGEGGSKQGVDEPLESQEIPEDPTDD